MLLLFLLFAALLGVGNHMPSFDTTRATAIARRQAEDDYDHYAYCDCEFCVTQAHHCDELGADECCSLCEHPTTLTECSQRAARSYAVQDIRSGAIVYITHLYSLACKVLHRQHARAYFRVIER
jgi:plasmid stabilization system protein ParE